VGGLHSEALLTLPGYVCLRPLIEAFVGKYAERAG